MTSQRLFNGIAHDIAHHAQSGVSWLHPHLGIACKSIGTLTVTLDLLVGSYDEGFPVSERLARATQAVRQKFLDMVLQAELDESQLRRAVLHFQFSLWKDDSTCVVKSEFELHRGGAFTHIIE